MQPGSRATPTIAGMPAKTHARSPAVRSSARVVMSAATLAQRREATLREDLGAVLVEVARAHLAAEIERLAADHAHGALVSDAEDGAADRAERDLADRGGLHLGLRGVDAGAAAARAAAAGEHDVHRLGRGERRGSGRGVAVVAHRAGAG